MRHHPRPPSPLKIARALHPARFQMPPKHPVCGKRRCVSEDHALAYVLWLAVKSKDPLRIYACDRCAGFHVTKLPTWKDPNR